MIGNCSVWKHSGCLTGTCDCMHRKCTHDEQFRCHPVTEKGKEGLEVTATVGSEVAGTGAGFRHADKHEATKGWLDQSITWVIPTRGFYHYRIVDSWDMLDWPMNQARTGRLTAANMEVGDAYNYLFRLCMDAEFCGKFYNPLYTKVITETKFILTTEEDNILPSNAITGLMGSLYTCPDCGKDVAARGGHRDAALFEAWTCEDGHPGYDAVSGLYFTKGLPPRPMAYGDPANGPDDFTPRSVDRAIKDKATIEVNGIAMGCAIWRKPLIEKVSQPWFQTTPTDVKNGHGGGTQDLFFCKKAKTEAGARFGVNCGVKIGHMNYKTLEIF